jgi:hypothetical protein
MWQKQALCSQYAQKTAFFQTFCSKFKNTSLAFVYQTPLDFS